MSFNLNILAFRATDNHELREQYHKGLEQILLHYGVSKVTSQSKDWFDDPDTWLVVVVSEDTKQVLGGARLQMAKQGMPLPMENAVGYKDSKVYDIVKDYREKGGVSELCGLWNSRKVAGMGLGSVFLGRACVALSPFANMKTVLALCAPSTKENCFRIGFELLDRLGTAGEFNYPKENLVATSVVIEDVENLPYCKEIDRNKIFELRNNTNLATKEDTPRGEIFIQYKLL